MVTSFISSRRTCGPSSRGKHNQSDLSRKLCSQPPPSMDYFAHRYLPLNSGAILAILLLLLTGCSPEAQEPAPPAGNTSLAGTGWELVIVGDSVLAGEPSITAVFSEDGRLSGSAGCNRYFGTYEEDAGALSFSGLGSTRRACPEPIMALESLYLESLEAVEGWKLAGERLTLLGPSGVTLLDFSLMEETPEQAP